MDIELPPPTKTIMHVDMNSFFASAEQQANPFLRGKSMGVGHRGYNGCAILAASYPAKWQGIGLATRYNEAKRIDPSFELAEIDPLKYYDLHNRFILILERYTPIVEVYSIDEAFMDVTGTASYFGGAEEIAYEIKSRIINELGEALTCSVGIGGNKLITKIASDYDKPDGITNIRWQERFEYLDPMQINDVWGIGHHVSKKMYARGITKVKQIRDLSDADLYAIVGGYYTRLRLLVNGYNFEPVIPGVRKKPAQSMQHAHTLERATNSKTELKTLTRKMAERLCIRLRKNRQKALSGFIGFAKSNMGKYDWNFGHWFGSDFRLERFTDHGFDIYKKCVPIIDSLDLKSNGGMRIRRLTVGIHNLTLPQTISFEDLQNTHDKKMDAAFDKINDRFGNFTIRTADILHQYAKETELSVNKREMRFHGNV